MKKLISAIIFILVSNIAISAHAFWVWDPKTHKIIDPRYAVKDTPEEQYNWAMNFYKKNDYERSSAEFMRLVQHYGNAELAPMAQYYAGRSFDAWGKYYRAFQEYQKLIDNYPFSKKIEDVIKREYRIANRFYSKPGSKLVGYELLDSLDKALEVYNQVIDNAPYGEYADKSQFKIGLCYKKLMQYNEAVTAFQKVIDDHPKSRLVKEARYEVANCTYLASLKPDYDQEPTDEAIEEYKRFARASEDPAVKEEAETVISQLEEKKAESAFKTASFYERQKHYKSAAFYYREIVENYPNTKLAEAARQKLELMKTRIKD